MPISGIDKVKRRYVFLCVKSHRKLAEDFLSLSHGTGIQFHASVYLKRIKKYSGNWVDIIGRLCKSSVSLSRCLLFCCLVRVWCMRKPHPMMRGLSMRQIQHTSYIRQEFLPSIRHSTTTVKASAGSYPRYI